MCRRVLLRERRHHFSGERLFENPTGWIGGEHREERSLLIRGVGRWAPVARLDDEVRWLQPGESDPDRAAPLGPLASRPRLVLPRSRPPSVPSLACWMSVSREEALTGRRPTSIKHAATGYRLYWRQWRR